MQDREAAPGNLSNFVVGPPETKLGLRGNEGAFTVRHREAAAVTDPFVTVMAVERHDHNYPGTVLHANGVEQYVDYAESGTTAIRPVGGPAQIEIRASILGKEDMAVVIKRLAALVFDVSARGTAGNPS